MMRSLLMLTMILGAMLIVTSAVALRHPQEPTERAPSDEEIKPLIVMIKSRIGGTESIGAGIIFSASGNRIYIATANHLVRQGTEETQDVRVELKWLPGEFVQAKLLETADKNLDLAVLSVVGEIGSRSLPFDQLGDPTTLNRGDAVYSIGNPRGHKWSVNVAPDRISGKSGDEISYESVFIGPGHSGGGLLNQARELVGMIKADEPPDGVAVNIRSVLDVLRRWGYPIKLRQKQSALVDPPATPPKKPVENDIGQTKSNGFYEVTLENVTTDHSGQHPSCFEIQPYERALVVRFTIKAVSNSVSPYTRKENDTDFLVVDEQGRRFERKCGNGWYGSGARTITMVYALPESSREFKFRFQNPGHGDALTFSIPEIR
ncbi:MAG TPA: serine protease [Pyrinomonadaceae bacterium]|nr:serine protease [Pyrinomonadaceae bacterium]